MSSEIQPNRESRPSTRRERRQATGFKAPTSSRFHWLMELRAPRVRPLIAGALALTLTGTMALPAYAALSVVETPLTLQQAGAEESQQFVTSAWTDPVL